MSRTGDRLSGALPSVGALVVTSILAGIRGRSTLISAGAAVGARRLDRSVVDRHPEQAASPASSAERKASIAYARNTSTAIMSATVSLARPTVLVIHDDGDALDLMTRLFEASGFEVITAVTGFRAQAHLEGDRPIDVVVAPWDVAHPRRRRGLPVVAAAPLRPARPVRVHRRRRSPPSSIDIVAGRCLAVSMARPAEIVRVALAAVKRRTSARGRRAMPSRSSTSTKPRAPARR